LFAEQVEKRRFEREVETAAEIQARLLPRAAPSIPGYAFAGRNSPCYQVGGDYWDCLPLDERRRAIVLADVAGKGIGAALLMAGLQATVHARVETGPSPRRLIDQLNLAMAQRAPSNRFATLFLMELDPTIHRARCVNAGHAPPPVVVRADASIEPIASGGPPLGVLPGFEFEVTTLELGPGDLLVACSDGVTETANEAGELFGDDRLLELLRRRAGQSPEAVCRAIQRALADHAAGAGSTDDLTIVVLQRRR
jgi:sigma-B regulation protein RsbU (phosphoserine phosphatase)